MNRALPLLILLLALSCCTRRPAPIPRPDAYPRMEVYPASYRSVRVAGLELQVNDSARVDSVGPNWFDIVYPAYGARLNCTVTPLWNRTTLPRAIENRLERLERDLAGQVGQMEQLQSVNGTACWLIYSPGAMVTPLRFLATDSTTYLLSAVAVFASPGTEPDSIAPAVNALKEDITYLISRL